MAGPSIDATVWYRCRDGKLVRNPGDCFENSANGQAGTVELGAGGNRTRFLGARGRQEFDPTRDVVAVETPKPEALDRGKLLGVALAAFAILVLLAVLAKRRKRP